MVVPYPQIHLVLAPVTSIMAGTTAVPPMTT